jgi:hypothetical protein
MELENFIAAVAFMVVSGIFHLRWLCQAHPEYVPDGPSFSQQLAAAPGIVLPGIGAGLSVFWII